MIKVLTRNQRDSFKSIQRRLIRLDKEIHDEEIRTYIKSAIIEMGEILQVRQNGSRISTDMEWNILKAVHVDKLKYKEVKQIYRVGISSIVKILKKYSMRRYRARRGRILYIAPAGVHQGTQEQE